MAKNTISFTAWVVITTLAAFRRQKPELMLISERNYQFYETAIRYCCRQFKSFRLLKLVPDHARIWLTEHILARGAALHFARRKQVIEQAARSAIASGTQQIIVLGAGFDPLALNLAGEYPTLQCFELDTHDMAAHKRIICAEFQPNLPTNWHSIAANFDTHSLYEILKEIPYYDITKPSFFIAEGLSMYLSEAQVIAMLADIKRLSPNAELIWTAIPPATKKRVGVARRVITSSSIQNFERFSWSLPASMMEEFLKKHTYQLIKLYDYVELQHAYIGAQTIGILEQQAGEYIVIAKCNNQ